jgi:transketolase
VKPLDRDFLTRAFAGHRVVATLEEHSRIGGLGGAVAEWKADQIAAPARLLRFGTDDAFPHGGLDHSKLRNACGLSVPSLGKNILDALA